MRQGSSLEQIEQMQGWISPRLGVRFEVIDGELELYHPDGTRFRSYTESEERAEEERIRAEQERLAKERAWAKLRELGIDPETLSG